ncbi:MAG TPA: FAD-dependent oxidoreductase [Nevskiaceae bacterium]|nr:FAD-dependent oxidoreductase [Nevskiaceae bacterium]
MQHTTEDTRSLWMDGAHLPIASPLMADTETGVCIVGAGIAGLSTAYLLLQHGHDVLVLDDKTIAGGQTARTSAHLSCVIDDRYTEIERVHGEAGALLAQESHRAAIELIERIVQDEQIDCDFERVDAYLMAGDTRSADDLRAELAAARRAGLSDAVEAQLPLPDLAQMPAIRFPRQAQFHPLKYIDGLARAVTRLGGRIHTRTHVSSVKGGAPALVRTSSGLNVRAHSVVVATNTPINDRAVLHTKQAPYTTYVVGITVPRGVIPHALYWDMDDPYHYVRVQRMGDDEVLIVGGEDHKTGQAHDKSQRFTRLVEWARARFPQLGELRYSWSGQVYETLDGLAYIGHNPLDRNNVYVVSGDSGMGLTHGTLAALILSALIDRREHPWAALYDPARKPLKTLTTFVQENLNVARQYGEWLVPEEVKSAHDVLPGWGAVVQDGAAKHAVYRDDDGTLSVCSAVCPHLGCVVAWNAVEKIWDCPCHGSRFDRYGHVISGPAVDDLAPVATELDEPPRLLPGVLPTREIPPP